MLSVLLVDDEILVRTGLRATIDFKKYGFGTVLEAESGLKAIELYKKYRPDLIITDIKMPGMNGIEFIAQITEINDNDCQFIILSGYNDFEYVKSALTFGVIDYILKPIQNEDLEAMLLKAHKKITALKQEKNSVNELNQKLQFLHANFLSGILLGSIKKEDIRPKINSYLNDFKYKEFYVAYVKTDSPLNEISRLFQGFLLQCKIDFNIYAFIVFDDEEFTFVKKLLAADFGAELGISESFDDIENIPLAYTHSKTAFAGLNGQEVSFYVDDNGGNVDLLIEKAKDYVKENYASQIIAGQVAQNLHLSESYFYFLFKKNTGLSFHDYLTGYRVEMALKLIKLRKYKIYEICNMVGYSDLKHFRKVFKKHTGKLPTDVIRSITGTSHDDY